LRIRNYNLVKAQFGKISAGKSLMKQLSGKKPSIAIAPGLQAKFPGQYCDVRHYE